MANLTLAEMQMIKTIEDFDSEKVNVFYFPVVDSTTSHLLESLLYRLENLDSTNYIYLAETSAKVRKKQIQTGLFVEKDLGKSRSDVLAERYSDIFSTKIYSGFRVKTQVTEFIKAKVNLFYISTNSKTEENYNVDLISLKEVTTYRVADGQIPSIFLLNAIYNGEDTSIQFNLIRDKKIHGTVQNIESTVVKTTSYDEFSRNNMTAQIMFNMINSVITDGMGINYSHLYGKFFDETPMEKEYIFGLYESAIFNRLDIPSITTKYPIGTLNKISKEFDRFKEQNEEDLEINFAILNSISNYDLALEFHMKLFNAKISNILKTISLNENLEQYLEEHPKVASRILEVQNNIESYKVWKEFTENIYIQIQNNNLPISRDEFIRTSYDLIAFFESKLGSLMTINQQTVTA